MHALQIQLFKINENQPFHTRVISEYRFSIGPEQVQIADLLLEIDSYNPEIILFEKDSLGYKVSSLDDAIAIVDGNKTVHLSEGQKCKFNMLSYQINLSCQKQDSVNFQDQNSQEYTDNTIGAKELNLCESANNGEKNIESSDCESLTDSSVSSMEKDSLDQSIQIEKELFEQHYRSAEQDLQFKTNHKKSAPSKLIHRSLLLSSFVLFLMSFFIYFQVNQKQKQIQRMVDHIEVLSHQWSSEEKMMTWMDKVSMSFDGKGPKNHLKLTEDEILDDFFTLIGQQDEEAAI